MKPREETANTMKFLERMVHGVFRPGHAGFQRREAQVHKEHQDCRKKDPQGINDHRETNSFLQIYLCQAALPRVTGAGLHGERGPEGLLLQGPFAQPGGESSGLPAAAGIKNALKSRQPFRAPLPQNRGTSLLRTTLYSGKKPVSSAFARFGARRCKNRRTTGWIPANCGKNVKNVHEAEQSPSFCGFTG